MQPGQIAQSLGLYSYSNDIGTRDEIKKNRLIINEIDGRHEDTNRKPMDERRKEQDDRKKCFNTMVV